MELPGQVVHAERMERDRRHDDQLVVAVVVGNRRRTKGLRRQGLCEGLGHRPRRLLEALGVDVGTEPAEEVASRPPTAR